MKNNKWLVSIFSIFVLMFVSCRESLLQNYDDQRQTGTISISVNASSARNILPDTSATDFTDFVLSGSTNGETYSTLGSWNSFYELCAAVIELDSGNWKLILTAKRAGVQFSASARVTVEAGQNVTANFALSTSNTQNGTVNITLRYPKKSNVDLVAWWISEVDDNTLYPLLHAGNDVATNYCFKDPSITLDPSMSLGEAVQSISDTVFTMQTELPAGKYMLFCQFGSQFGELVIYPEGGFSGFSAIGNYSNYIVIQPGLESKVDYTIDYFDFVGITECESTSEGMVLTIDVPKGVNDIVIERMVNYDEVMQSGPTEAMYNNVIGIVKVLETPTTSSTTMTLVDPYGYKTGEKLTYVTAFNYFSSNTMNQYYVKTYTADYDGYTVPGFSTRPQFATEQDNEGKPTKLKVVNNPVIDWKGHEVDSDYLLFVAREIEDAVFMEEYVFDKDHKETTVDADTLHTGPNSLSGYRMGFFKDGWIFNCPIDTTGYQSSELPPDLMGNPCAVPTDKGISIEVYCNTDYEPKEVRLIRSTAVDGNYEIIKDFTTCTRDTFQYLDRKNLVQGTTYYYKLEDRDGNTYGGPYFFATSSINFGTPVTITTRPKLEITNNCIATFTNGTFQFDEHVTRISIKYMFRQKDNSNEVILFVKEMNKSGDVWKENDLHVFKAQLYGNGGIASSNFIVSYLDNTRNVVDFYNADNDGAQFDFDNAL